MIFMGVRQHQTDNIAAFLDQITNIRKNKLDPGKIIAGKRNAEIDRKPPPLPLGAKTIERQIHADLADAAERRENELIGGWRHARVSVSAGAFSEKPADGRASAPYQSAQATLQLLRMVFHGNSINSRS